MMVLSTRGGDMEDKKDDKKPTPKKAKVVRYGTKVEDSK